MTDVEIDFETALKRMVHRVEIDDHYSVDDAALALAIVFEGIGAVMKSTIIQRLRKAA